MGHGIGRDPAGLAFAAQDADVEVRVIVKDPELGRLRRVLAGPRVRLTEAGEGFGRAPDRVGEEPVDLRSLRDADGLQPFGTQARDENEHGDQEKERPQESSSA